MVSKCYLEKMSHEILAQNLGISILMYSAGYETAWIIQGYCQELVGWLGQLPALVEHHG